MKKVTLNANFIIKQLRIGHHLSQVEIANIFGVAQQEYSRWEQNGYKISLSNLIKIARFYNISLDCIAGLKLDYQPLWEELDENSAIEYLKKHKTDIFIEESPIYTNKIFENIPFEE